MKTPLERLILLCLGLFLTYIGAEAQDLQLHYLLERKLVEVQKEQAPVLLTFEHLSNDKWGETAWFIDLYSHPQKLSQAYMEIARELKFWKAPVGIHLEYNGGLQLHEPLNNAYLLGFSYMLSGDSGYRSLKLSSSYRYDAAIRGLKEEHHGMQLTGVWLWTSWNRVFSFNGFFDVWTKETSPESKGIVLCSEPQLWLNLYQLVGVSDAFKLSLGSELRLSYNFLKSNTFYALPTLALKWTF